MLKKNKGLRTTIIKKSTDLETEKKQNLRHLHKINELQMKITRLESGDAILEQRESLSKMRQRLKNLDRLFSKEKEEALRFKSENQKLLNFLKTGISNQNLGISRAFRNWAHCEPFVKARLFIN